MVENKKYPMTKAGKERLKQELTHLKMVKRNESIERIKKARTFCDFPEDYEYADAIREQDSVEERIQLVEKMLRNTEIIEHTNMESNKISLGHTVTIMEIPDGHEETYTIVGKVEAEPSLGKISNESPMAKSLLGHKVNDVIKILAPGGQIKIKILKIQ